MLGKILSVHEYDITLENISGKVNYNSGIKLSIEKIQAIYE